MEHYEEYMEERGAYFNEEIDAFVMDVYNPQTKKVEKLNTDSLRGKFFVLFFYPADFTFVCPTELKELNDMYDEIRNEDAAIVVISKDTVYTHKAWVETEPLLKGFRILMASDRNGDISEYFGVESESGNSERATFIIDPDGVLKAVEVVDEPIGRSAKELLRKIKALKFVRENPGKACPAGSAGEAYIEPSIDIAGHVGDVIKGN